ncbi:MAG: hypothetical protein HYZ23_10780 [Chloroflexi bacterium]|nr:hypothetical protein [Chloroflexota bacterium]
MKKYAQIFVAISLLLTIVGVARSNPAWASSLLKSDQPSAAALPPIEIDVSESGSYYVGGLCEFNALYTSTGASAKAAVDVPAEESRNVPYGYDGELYLAGCHIIHYVLDAATNDKKETREMSPTYGSWEVCFGDRPDVELLIYYYFDKPESGSPAWIPLTTTHKDGFACAPAQYTGVYAPAAVRPPIQDGSTVTENPQVGGGSGGTVVTPPTSALITESGTYSAGGICTLEVEYFLKNLSNDLHVEENIDVSQNVPFPDNEGLLYLPGCHVFHYVDNALVKDVNTTTEQGKWKICFAAIPGKKTTIYFYYARDDKPDSALPDWTPLETTIENGMACAPLTEHTGVYAPTGK